MIAIAIILVFAKDPKERAQRPHKTATASVDSFDSGSFKTENTPATESAQREPDSQRQPSSLESFFTKYQGQWQVQRQADGNIHSIFGGMIPAANPAAILSLAQELAPVLGAQPNHLQSPVETATSERTRRYTLQQEVDGWSVYQGSLTLVQRKVDNQVFMINNQLRNIASFAPQINLTAQQIRQNLQTRFPQADIGTPEKPVVFVSNSATELAWVFTVQSRHPAQTHDHDLSHKELVFSAKDGRELYQQENTIRN